VHVDDPGHYEGDGHDHADHSHDDHSDETREDAAAHPHATATADPHAEETPGAGAEYEHGHSADDGHDHSAMGGMDPHFWLDPIRLSARAQPIADAMADADPANAETFQANADALIADLKALDTEIADALAPFVGATLITNHTAFGYLAQRYELQQIGITGLDHEIEPSAARLLEIGNIARAYGVQTLFYETLVSPRVVQTLAHDLGLGVANLDTLEGLTEANAAAGQDYFSLMRLNVEKLVAGLVAP
jgi:zinc transport system substrate-binding protein